MKTMKKIFAVALCVFALAAFAVPAAFAGETEKLSFRDDGTFKIMQVTDIQDDQNLNDLAVKLISGAIEKELPDVIILTGDNIAGYRTLNAKNSETAIRAFMDVFERYGIPVIVTFGNHDIYESGLTREQQMDIYLSYDCVSETFQNGNLPGDACVPVYSSDGSAVKFLLWALDTGANEGADGSRVDSGGVGYDHVRDDQIDWFDSTYASYASSAGAVNSMIFQHIIVPEIFDALKEAKFSDPGAMAKYGKYWVLPDNAKPGSILGESPCPSANNGGEFSSAKANGSVLAVACGHDHNNSFIVPYEGIDIICTPTCGFQSYGADEIKGVRVITLNEADTTVYDSYIVHMEDCTELGAWDEFKYKLNSVMQFVYSFFNNLWQRIVSVFNLGDNVL